MHEGRASEVDLANGQLAYLWILLLFHIKHLNKYKFYIYCFFLHQHSILLCFFLLQCSVMFLTILYLQRVMNKYFLEDFFKIMLKLFFFFF